MKSLSSVKYNSVLSRIKYLCLNRSSGIPLCGFNSVKLEELNAVKSIRVLGLMFGIGTS